MKFQLVGSRAKPVGMDLDHCTVQYVDPHKIRFAQRTQTGRIVLACFLAAFGLQCLPAMLERPTRGALDALLHFAPLIAVLGVALLVAFRKKTLLLDRSARCLSAESWLGPMRIGRSVEPLAEIENLHLHSEYIHDTEVPSYWLYTVSIEGQTQLNFYTKEYRRASKIGAMFSAFFSANLADYCDQESRRSD